MRHIKTFESFLNESSKMMTTKYGSDTTVSFDYFEDTGELGLKSIKNPKGWVRTVREPYKPLPGHNTKSTNYDKTLKDGIAAFKKIDGKELTEKGIGKLSELSKEFFDEKSYISIDIIRFMARSIINFKPPVVSGDF